MADAYADFNDAVLGRKRRRMPDEMSGYEPDQEFNAPAPTAAAPPSPTPASPPIPLADSLQADQGDRQPPPRQQRVQATTSTLSAAPTMPPPPPPPPPTPGFDPNASTQSMVSGGGGGFQRAPTSGLPMTTSGSRLPIAAQVGAQASPYADLAQGVEQYQDLGGDAIRRAPTDSNTLPPATGPTGGNPVGTPETQAAQPTWQPNAQEGQGERDANHFAAATNFRDQQSGVQGFRDLYHRDPTASDAAEVERLRKMNAAPDDNPLYRGFEEAVRAGVLPNTQEGMGQWLAANSQRGDDPNAATFRKYMEQGGDTSFQRSDALKAKSAADAARIAITGREKTPDEQRQEQIDGMLQGIARINGIAGTELPTSNVKMGNLEITPEEYAAAMRRIGAKTRQPG